MVLTARLKDHFHFFIAEFGTLQCAWIQSEADMKIMTVGHACIDVVHWVPGMLSATGKTDSRDSRVQVGGSAANVAMAARRLGADAVLCAVLGSTRDPLTSMLLASMANRGIEVDCTHIDSAPCPSTIVAVADDGENALASHQPESIRDSVHLPGSLSGIGMVMGDTYRLPMVAEVFSMAKAAGIPTMLDVDKAVPGYRHLPQADYIWFSQESWQGLDPSVRGLAMAQAHFGGCVGTTNGPGAVVWIDHTGSIDEFAPQATSASNTLGAGDVFRAALAIGLCKGFDLAMAVPMACASAGQHVSGRPLSKLTK